MKLKKAYVLIEFHLDVELQQDVYQIGVGSIEHIKILPSKGALPANGVLDSKSLS